MLHKFKVTFKNVWAGGFNCCGNTSGVWLERVFWAEWQGLFSTNSVTKRLLYGYISRLLVLVCIGSIFKWAINNLTFDFLTSHNSLPLISSLIDCL